MLFFIAISSPFSSRTVKDKDRDKFVGTPVPSVDDASGVRIPCSWRKIKREFFLFLCVAETLLDRKWFYRSFDSNQRSMIIRFECCHWNEWFDSIETLVSLFRSERSLRKCSVDSIGPSSDEIGAYEWSEWRSIGSVVPLWVPIKDSSYFVPPLLLTMCRVLNLPLAVDNTGFDFFRWFPRKNHPLRRRDLQTNHCRETSVRQDDRAHLDWTTVIQYLSHNRWAGHWHVFDRDPVWFLDPAGQHWLPSKHGWNFGASPKSKTYCQRVTGTLMK